MAATVGQLSPYLQPVRLGALGDLARTWIELGFQGRVVQLARQGPAQADRPTPLQAGPDSALGHIQAVRDLAQAPLFGVQPEHLAYTTHRQSPLGHLVLPSAKWVYFAWRLGAPVISMTSLRPMLGASPQAPAPVSSSRAL